MLAKMLQTYREKLGPGLMFAAVAVGVSHLVQSTRAGANYGLALCGLIIITCLIKYPAFRFGSDYSAATGKPLLDAYEKQGRIVLLIYLFGFPLDMFIATAAISLVTAGIFENVFAFDIDDIVLSCLIMVSCTMLLLSGRYKIFESITKTIVVIFALLAFITAILAVPELPWGSGNMSKEIVFDERSILFMIAIAGWMPTGVSVSMFQSIWVCEKIKSLDRPLPMSEARFDFDLGYFGSLLLALCFVIIGAAVMFNSGVVIESSPSGFASQLISMFTQVIGQWAQPLIALAALAVMVSTALAALDACPRIATEVSKHLFPSLKESRFNLVSLFMIGQVIGSTFILIMFLKSFKTFIDFATSVAFITAPALAWFNHRAVFSANVNQEDQPGEVLRIWSFLGIAVMTGVALYYISIKLL